MYDMTGTMGRSLIAALALAEHVAETVERLIRAEAEARHLRGLLDHTMGQRDAFREEAREASHRSVISEQHVATLADENRLLTREAADLRLDVASLDESLSFANEALTHAKRSCAELQCHVDRARAERDEVAVALGNARTELAALRKLTESSVPTMPNEGGGAWCAWCDNSLGVDRYGSEHFICRTCYNDSRISWQMVRARVAGRAAGKTGRPGS